MTESNRAEVDAVSVTTSWRLEVLMFGRNWIIKKNSRLLLLFLNKNINSYISFKIINSCNRKNVYEQILNKI